MAKKKSKKSKKDRRKKEIIKAHAKGGIGGSVVGRLIDKDVINTTPKRITHRLHTREIKTDLVKTALFAILTVILLLILRSQGLEFDFGVNK